MTVDVNHYIDEIKERGYSRIPGVFSAQTIDATLKQVQQEAANNNQPVTDIPKLDSGQETVYNLQNKNIHFVQLMLKSQLIKQVLMTFLNDEWHKAIPLDDPNYILRSYSARNNQVAAPLHIDSFIPYQGGHPLSMQVAIILEDQNKNNGCTVVIPGSHQSGEYVGQEEIENAKPIESNAGDVVIWDSRIWHGTLENRSGKSRWSLIATFVRWWIKQGYQITENLPEDIYQQLNESEKAILGYCSRPLTNEYEGIDFKKSYASLKPKVSDY